MCAHGSFLHLPGGCGVPQQGLVSSKLTCCSVLTGTGMRCEALGAPTLALGVERPSAAGESRDPPPPPGCRARWPAPVGALAFYQNIQRNETLTVDFQASQGEKNGGQRAGSVNPRHRPVPLSCEARALDTPLCKSPDLDLHSGTCTQRSPPARSPGAPWPTTLARQQGGVVQKSMRLNVRLKEGAPPSARARPRPPAPSTAHKDDSNSSFHRAPWKLRPG